MKIIWFVFLLCPAVTWANDLRPKDTLRWQALLHVKDSLFGPSSEADGEKFFFSPQGKKDEWAEYEANVAQYEKDPTYRCYFPARAKFIAIEKNEEINFNHCPEYLEYRERLSAKAISLVFSTYYLNNPSSAFGHTLLRFKKSKEVEESERYQLLDYAANFSANVTTSNALFYAIKGIVGGFKGEFAVMPYFYKVREYNDFESRDLWDYQLAMNEDEVDWVIAHLWEMKQTHFDYYYVSENCSYHILGLINVANPSWNLMERIDSYVPPVDTIRAVAQTPGLLERVSFRPSKRRVLLASYESLSPEQRETFNKSSLDRPPNLSGAEESKAQILDALIEYFDFKNAEAIVSEDKEVQSKRQEFLIARAQTGVSSKVASVVVPENEAPHLGHETLRLGVMGGHHKEGKTMARIGLRFALHDLLDPLPGQNPNAILEMLNFELKYFGDLADRSKVKLSRADLIQILSLSPFNTLIPKASWRLRLGSELITDASCNYCYTPSLDSAYGLSFGSEHFKFGLFLHAEFQANKEFSHEGYRYGAGPEGFLLFRSHERVAFKLFASQDWWIKSHQKYSYEWGAEAAYHLNRNTSLKLSHQRERGNYESLIGTNFFF